MTKQHKATPEQWAYAEACAPEDFAGYSCILELRDRIEALEVGQQPQQDKLDRLIALDRDDPAEDAAQQPPLFTAEEVARIVAPSSPANSLVERVATDAELCQVYNDAPEHGFGPALRAVYDLGRQHGAVPIRSGPESPLVERVADAIAAQATSTGIVNDRPARAAILEVAAWLKEEGYSTLQAEALAQEANR
jgi:hypothetical protein